MAFAAFTHGGGFAALTMMASSPTPAIIPRDCIECDAEGCGKTAPTHNCSNCKTVYYCSLACQRRHWKTHKPYCYSVEWMKKKMMGLGEGAKLSDETGINSECAICLETAMKNPIVLEGCKHAFCSSCLLRWQERKRFSPFSAEIEGNLNCPLCRSETPNVAESLLVSAKLNAERANRPGCTPDEQARFREQALTNVEQALDSETPHLHAYCIKIDVLNAIGDGRAALECIDELKKVNEERWEQKRELTRMLAQADAAIARSDENADELMESVIERVAKSGLPGEVLDDAKQTQIGIQLQRAEAFQVLDEWEEAKDVYIQMLMSLEGPEDASPPQNRQVFMGLSRCAYELGVFDRSIFAAEAALEMNRHFQGVHKYKALSEKASGDIDAAIRTMNRAVLYETPWDEDNKAEVLKLYNELLAEKAGS